LVHLGADACIVGRNVEKTEAAARDIATVRPGAKVIGIGAVDVRKSQDLQNAADRCAKELGGIDFVMYADPYLCFLIVLTSSPVLGQRAISSRPLTSSPLMHSSP